VYYKQPDTFVKKIRDRINERLDQEGEYVAPAVTTTTSKKSTPTVAKEEEYVDSMGVKRSEYIKESSVQQVAYSADLLGVDYGYRIYE
jgi:hypothetical protein